MVYLMPNGSIALDTRATKPDGVFITLTANGSAYCSGRTKGEWWRQRYDASRMLPDETLLREVEKLGSCRSIMEPADTEAITGMPPPLTDYETLARAVTDTKEANFAKSNVNNPEAETRIHPGSFTQYGRSKLSVDRYDRMKYRRSSCTW